MYPLVESIRAENGQFFLLDYHQDRLERTFQAVFKRSCPWQLKDLLPAAPNQGLFKLRFLYNATTYSIEVLPYVPKEIKTLKFGNASIFKSLEFSLEFFCKRFVIVFKKLFPLNDGTVMSATALQFFNVQDNSLGVEKVLIAEMIAPILAIANVAMIHSGLFGANSATLSPGFTPR